jgi:prepilin-type N-terminal cleavage/methylation domain-containing protein
MRDRGVEAAGFSLVEVVIAMFLLGIIAVALLPPLWNGLLFSTQQSSTATATRHLNTVVEQARSMDATCSSLVSFAASPPPVEDGQGRELGVTTSVLVFESRGGAAAEWYVVDSARCVSSTPTKLHDAALDLTVNVTGSGGTTLASTRARIFVK